MWRGVLRLGVTAVALSLIVAACSESASEPALTVPPVGTVPADCEPIGGRAFEDLDRVTLEELGDSNGATVYGALYPHPDYDGNPWSQWGEGQVSSDGRFYSAIGDHLGPDGNSFIYEYEPTTRTLTLVSDVLSHADHRDGDWGFGKVHSQMVEGLCGEIYFSTYWGTSRELEYTDSYTGDLLFVLDPIGRTLQPIAVPVDQRGTPSLAGDPSTGLLYGEAADPEKKAEGVDSGPFYVFDPSSGATVYEGPEQPHVGFRSILVDVHGNAYYSTGSGELVRYEVATGDVSERDGLPGDRLRAVTSPAPSGTVYGVTQDPDHFFSMDSEGNIDSLSSARGYTTSLGLDPTGSRFFYMPGAHGNSSDWDSPLIAVDTESGDEEVIVELRDMVEDALGYTVGGTYNVAVSPDGGTVYMGVNAGEKGSDSTFGEVILLVIELP